MNQPQNQPQPQTLAMTQPARPSGIQPEQPVAAIARAHPATVPVFQRHRIDFCCGGKRPLAEVCVEQGLDLQQMVGDLERAVARPAETRDWNAAPLAELADHIERRYHDSLRRELPLLGELALKVASRHGEQRPELVELRSLFETLRREMLEHTAKEEKVLFPLVRRMEAAARGEESPVQVPAIPLAGPIAALEDDHDRAGWILSRLRSLTDDYTPPASACNSYRGLFQGLADLESDTHVHIHLENNILFPRAQELSQSSAAA